jgi:release factor glutamine methyltransferase
LGTGSGCLAIALATHCPQAAVVATDLSEPALAVARRNAAAHRVTERIQFRCGDGFGPVPAVSRLDLIIANPPYIASGEIASLPPEVREHEPRMALDGGPDGLTVLRRLACEGPAYLAADGRLMTELADGQAAAARAVFAEQGWRVEAVLPDDAGCPRILIAGRAGA